MATNTYKANRAQIEALAAPIPQTWEYIWSEYQDIKREADELDARCQALEATVDEAAAKRIGTRPVGAARDVVQRWLRQRDAIAQEVAPELKGLQHQFDEINDFTYSLEKLLIATPAPDSGALLFKLNLLWSTEAEVEGDDRSHGDSLPIEQIRATLMDARRLLSGEA
ncbi:hypothetical protein SH591_08770 [Sphingomonas sp. LY54]|uniref:hypothetical protein n=1 Tax=Sphingomonas sp. LY54 TaxID=3095343 RepID=UPI002D78A43F|nr:hypothetical protein [Sphingomonas sp. LY54]WRP27216.1 hypothetical protein SH591_08770 [Sphingomonas sp. LY54]